MSMAAKNPTTAWAIKLESTKKALDLAERTLISLKKKVYPVNPQKYSILAEPYLEYINRLRTEKDEYIGLARR